MRLPLLPRFFLEPKHLVAQGVPDPSTRKPKDQVESARFLNLGHARAGGGSRDGRHKKREVPVTIAEKKEKKREKKKQRRKNHTLNLSPTTATAAAIATTTTNYPSRLAWLPNEQKKMPLTWYERISFTFALPSSRGRAGAAPPRPGPSPCLSPPLAPLSPRDRRKLSYRVARALAVKCPLAAGMHASRIWFAASGCGGLAREHLHLL